MNKKIYIGICALLLALLTATLTSQAATITVTNNNNSGAGSLRQAVLDANISGNASDTIDFAANVRGKIVLTGFEIELNKPIGTNLTINGPGADVLSIESNFAFRVFRAQLGNIKISGLRISRGLASGFPAGGGIFVVESANLKLDSCVVAENTGGGIATMSGATLTVNNTTISGNEGGGIDGAGGLNISNSTVSDNFGTDNAGIRWLNGTVTLTNITVSGNRGIDSGGININGATTTILNSTIAKNFGGTGIAGHTGGLRIDSGTVNLKNTIIADNQAFTPDINGTIVSQGNNLIRDRTGGSGFIASDLPNGTNPDLGGFANNGGATYTHSLRSTSPAINAGNNTGAPATDQRGAARPQGATVDIGAYESGVRPVAFGKIVFVSNRDGNEEIYKIDADGTGLMRVTNNSAFDRDPDWSPDGSKIAFSRTVGNLSEIYTINASGTGEVNLTNSSASEFEPAWSPDGTKIAYSRTTSIFANDYELWVMEANGANPTQLTNTSGQARHPSWSPDGTKIVFTSFPGGTNSIDIINADGTNRRTITEGNQAGVNYPVWSPDGNLIAYNNDVLGEEIFFANPFDSIASPLRPLNNNPLGTAPAWSPDSAKLAYSRSTTGGALFIIDADGTNSTLLIPVVSGVFNEFPDWFGLNTPAGTNVSVDAGTTSITFSSVGTSGTTSAVPIDPATAGSLPGGYSLGVGFPAYEITTTAVYTAPITVCLKVPSVTNPAVFNALTLFHSEGGVLVNRTSSRDFMMKRICALVNSLSPFVVAENLSPTSANVSVGGRVSEFNGYPISRARVSITDQNGETRWAKTNSFGNYRFDEIPAGETYVISVSHKLYQFNSQVIAVSEDIQNADFTAEPE